MNGYFQVETTPQGTWLKIIPATDGGARCDLNDAKQYLMRMGIGFEVLAINMLANRTTDAAEVQINNQYFPPINETLVVMISPDHMMAAARFYPPSSLGQRLGADDIVNILHLNYVNYGIDMDAIQKWLNNRVYCENIVLATGMQPGLGENAWVEYFFETNRKAKPTLNEDGTVDFFHLNNISHVKKGDVLAVLHPEVQGTPGMTVLGEAQAATVIKKGVLHYGRNIEISEDKLTIRSMVDGHATLVDNKVFVSDVYEVENVDNATGNIEYTGNVQVNGNICANFSVKAQGNVIVRGVVEGAYVEAGGDIIIAAGVNGMNKGVLKAGGNVISKFIENATVSAGGYVETESILHSKVSALTEITVVGHKGFITGGRVSATNLIKVKTLGSELGADTTVELGIDPEVKAHYLDLKTSLTKLDKTIRQLRPVIEAADKKKAAGLPILPEQANYIKTVKKQLKEQEELMGQQLEELGELEEVMEGDSSASVIVTGEVYSGTRITISGASTVVKDTVKYCKFIKDNGDIRITSI